MITRRGWWLGVLLITAALMLHALLPRYEFRWEASAAGMARFDRWTGTVELALIKAPPPWLRVVGPE